MLWSQCEQMFGPGTRNHIHLPKMKGIPYTITKTFLLTLNSRLVLFILFIHIGEHFTSNILNVSSYHFNLDFS